MRLKLIACKIMCREISRLISESENYIDVTYIRQGYHNEPDKLREILKREISQIDQRRDPHTCATDGMDFDALLLGFGLCSNGIAGLSSEKYDMVIPRAHDCASIFLGSSKKYRKIFDACGGGVYWYTREWIENCPMPCEENAMAKYERYREKYGKDNAEYLAKSEDMSLRNYKRAAFIDTGGGRKYAEFTKKAAEYYGWEYKEYKADPKLLDDFVNGRWDNERFLFIPKNCAVVPSYDENIIRAEKIKGISR